MATEPTLVLLTGPPGTGKSSLAERAADQLGAAVLAWDWAMAGLTGFEGIQAALREMSFGDHRGVGWSVLWNLATAELRRGRSVVLDGVARDVEIAGTRHTAEEGGARALVVVTSCHDRDRHQARVEGRVRGIPGWYELQWDQVSAFLDRWDPPGDADLYLDAVEPFAANADRLCGLLA